MPLFKENIIFESNRWQNEVLPKLEFFYKRAFFPEMLTKRLFTIYMGKPVDLRFGQIVRKFLYWEIPFGTGVCHLQKSLPFTKKFA